MEHRKPVIVVTGFGPFDIHAKNASWEAVKLLPDMDMEEECDVTLVVKEIPVAYNDGELIVPKLWQEYKPLLMVHTGVSRIATHLTLESGANRSGYTKVDVKECELPDGCHSLGDEEHLRTGIDLEGIRSEAESQSIDFIISNDAGRYLCEYIYYTSLNIDPERTIFVHVPMMTEDYTASKIAEQIKFVIKSALKQLRNETPSDAICPNIGEADAQKLAGDGLAIPLTLGRSARCASTSSAIASNSSRNPGSASTDDIQELIVAGQGRTRCFL